MIEFAYGAASVLAGEFLIAQFMLWRASKGSNSAIISTAVAKVKADAVAVETAVENEAVRVEGFFKNLWSGGTTPVPNLVITTAATPITTSNVVITAASNVSSTPTAAA
jgi:hypothetical protein